MLDFNELFEDKTKYGTKLKTDQYQGNGKNIIVDQGQNDIAGYTNIEEGLFTDVPVIIFGDHTRVVKYVDRPFFLGADGTKILKSKYLDANYKYLYYALKYIRIPNTGYNRHFKWLKKTEFKYPTKEEQMQIVFILDKIANLIQKYTSQIKLLDDVIKARFVEMFGDPILNDKDWKISTFDDLTYIITDGEHSTPKRTNQGIYLLSARNILNHRLHLEDVDFIDKNEFERIAKRVFPQEGDVLLSCSGTVGRCCIVPKNFKFQMVRSVALLRFKEEINPLFAEYMITSDYLQRQIDKAKTSSSQANLFQGKIKTLKGIVPPIELQSQFSDFVQQVDKSKFEIQKSLKKTQQLYDSLMQKYFG